LVGRRSDMQMAPIDEFTSNGSVGNQDHPNPEARRENIDGLPVDATAPGLYLNDLLYYNQEELVRRYVPVQDLINEDYGRDDNFPDEWEDHELVEYYEEPHYD